MYLYYKLPLTDVEKTLLRFWVQYLQKIAPEESMLNSGFLSNFE